MRGRGGANRRFDSAEIDPEKAVALRADHPALAEGRSIFPASLVGSAASPRFLVTGHNNPKIGRTVLKGPRAGWPIFMLTLEERATCPRSCEQWASCLVPGSRVLTADLRWVPIEGLEVGDRIAGFDEHGGAHRQKHRMSKVATVEALGRIVQPCYRIKTDRGEIIASAGHQWLTRKTRAGFDWFQTVDLAPGDPLPFFAKPWEEGSSYAHGRLRGFVEGEGSCGALSNGPHAKPRVGWSQLPGKLMDEITATAEGLGFTVAHRGVVSGVRASKVALAEIVGGWREVCRFIGSIRPTRLVEKAEALWENHDILGRGAEYARVISVEPVGDREVVTIKTSTNTMVAEGVFTHNCYGNAMPYARRHRVDEHFEELLRAEVASVARQHPDGLLIRLHVLGDFYSAEYVMLWARLLAFFPQLHVYGYTARRVDDPDPESAKTARAIKVLTDAMWSRFAIRTSGSGTSARSRSVVVDEDPELPDVIVCPAQTKATESCASCGLCWVDAARDKTIAFLRHGMARERGPRLRSVETPAEAPTLPRQKHRASPTPSARQVAMDSIMAALRRLAGEGSEVVVSYAALAQASHLPLGSVPRLVNELVARELLSLRREIGGRSGATIYTLLGQGAEPQPTADLAPAPAAEIEERQPLASAFRPREPKATLSIADAMPMVLAALRELAVSKASVTVSYSMLASVSHVPLGSIVAVISALEGLGSISVERPGDRRPNTYTLTDRAPTPQPTPTPQRAPVPAQPVARATPAPPPAPARPAAPFVREPDEAEVRHLPTLPADGKPCTLLQIAPTSCHFPVGVEEPQLYCNRPAKVGQYCSRHHAAMRQGSKK